MRILARDVSLARAPMTGTSVLNTLPAMEEDSVDDAHPALTLVKLRVGDSPLLARLTRRSAHALELAPGQLVYVQIKAVALIAECAWMGMKPRRAVAAIPWDAVGAFGQERSFAELYEEVR